MEKSNPESENTDKKKLAASAEKSKDKNCYDGLNRRDIDLRRKIAMKYGRQTDHLDLNNIMQEEADKKRKVEDEKLLNEQRRQRQLNEANSKKGPPIKK